MTVIWAISKMMTVKELREALEDYGDHLPVIIGTMNGDREVDSVDSGRVLLPEDSESNGILCCKIFTVDS